MREGGRAAQQAYAALPTARPVSVSELLGAFDCDELDERSARLITGSLAYSGMVCRPSLFQVLASRSGARGDASTVVVASTPRFAAQGAAAAAVVIAAIGYYRWWPYAALALAASAATAGALLAAFPELSRALPVGLPRGRLLGAAAVTIVCVVVLALFVVLR